MVIRERERQRERAVVAGRDWMALSSAGFCVGGLAGLSVSPVASIVIAAISGTLVSIVGAMSGLLPSIDVDTGATAQVESKPTVALTRHAFDPLPLAVVLVGLLLGSMAGIYARAHSLLSPLPAQTVSHAGQPTRGSEEPPLTREPKVSPTATVLFAASDAECLRFITRTGHDLRTEMLSSVSSDSARSFAKAVSDDTALAVAVRMFICPR